MAGVLTYMIRLFTLIIGWFGKNKPLELNFTNGEITEKWGKYKKRRKPTLVYDTNWFRNGVQVQIGDQVRGTDERRESNRYINIIYIAHRLDEPAIKYYYQHSIQVRCEKWYINGKQNRPDMPSEICYFQNGNIKCKKWYVDSQQHRLNKPAKICYFQNGNIECKKWYTYGKSHRLTGPAKICYNQNGTEIDNDTKWWVSGRQLTIIQTIERINKIKNKICIILNEQLINSYNYDININNIIASYTI
jgi:hypothetical protein